MKLMILENVLLFLQMPEKRYFMKIKNFTGVSGVTIECNNPHSVSEIAINFGLVKIKVTSHRH